MIPRCCLALGALGVTLALTACAGLAPTTEAPPAPPPDVQARIAVLEASIARDEEAVKAMISDPERVPGLREDPELLAIADRLPRMQAELEALRPTPEPEVLPSEESPAPAEATSASEPTDGP